jgi:hypothetical protein
VIGADGVCDPAEGLNNAYAVKDYLTAPGLEGLKERFP